MNLKVSLMMLMMVASLFASAQYPTTKKLNGEQVVIMTVPQAEQIDNQFTKLKDSILILNSKIKNKDNQIKVVDFKIEKTNDSLQIFKSNFLTASNKIDSLNIEMRRIEKLEYIEKRTRFRVGIGLVGILSTFISFAILVIKS